MSTTHSGPHTLPPADPERSSRGPIFISGLVTVLALIGLLLLAQGMGLVG